MVKLSTQLKIARNQNMIKLLKYQNKQLKSIGYKHTIIHLETPHELDYKCDYMGMCDCGCNKPLYRGMSVAVTGRQMIHIDCLERYLKKNLVVL